MLTSAVLSCCGCRVSSREGLRRYEASVLHSALHTLKIITLLQTAMQGGMGDASLGSRAARC